MQAGGPGGYGDRSGGYGSGPGGYTPPQQHHMEMRRH